MTIECEKCDSFFKHCKKCNFYTKGMKSHFYEYGVTNSINESFDNVINQNNTLKIRSTQMESEIKKFEMDI